MPARVLVLRESAWGCAYVPRTRETPSRVLPRHEPFRQAGTSVAWGKREHQIASVVSTSRGCDPHSAAGVPVSASHPAELFHGTARIKSRKLRRAVIEFPCESIRLREVLFASLHRSLAHHETFNAV